MVMNDDAHIMRFSSVTLPIGFDDTIRDGHSWILNSQVLVAKTFVLRLNDSGFLGFRLTDPKFFHLFWISAMLTVKKLAIMSVIFYFDEHEHEKDEEINQKAFLQTRGSDRLVLAC